MNFYPNSANRIRRALEQREGIELAPGPVTVACQLFDLGGGGGTSANQTTQTTSGNGRGIAGNKNQYTESGSISLGGNNSKYIEGGGIDVSGQKISAAKGGSITINQAPAPGSASSAGGPPLAPVDGSGTPPAPGTPAPPTTDPTATVSTPLLQTLQADWANFSNYQKLGAAAVLVLVLWLIFHKRK